MEGSGSSGSGFDVSKMSTAERMLAGGSILLLLVSFLPWQSYCVGDILGDLGGIEDLIEDQCATFTMWDGNGQWAGTITGLLAIALVVVGVLSMTGSMNSVNLGTMSIDQLVGYLGLGVAGFGLLKFLLVLTNEVTWGAFLGLVLLIAIGYGAWQKAKAGGGFQMGGGGAGGSGSMGGTPPRRGATPPSEPTPGGSSDM